ncbi:hypothetical protein ACFFX0_22560 [Citricoccus parietis]|uniref:Uncharacterized protein n=1 Tax=Citricoccus parietis TaxID=592307 RepID=A0ABV5G4G8_9MICC
MPPPGPPLPVPPPRNQVTARGGGPWPAASAPRTPRSPRTGWTRPRTARSIG